MSKKKREIFKDKHEVNLYDIIFYNCQFFILLDNYNNYLILYSMLGLSVSNVSHENENTTSIISDLEEHLNCILENNNKYMLYSDFSYNKRNIYTVLEPNNYREKIRKWVVKNKMLGLL